MTTPPEQSPEYTTLADLINSWDERLRKQQIVAWLARVLMIALGTGIMIGLFSRMRPWLSNGQVAQISVLLLWLNIMILGVGLWIWPRSLIKSARRFDHQFGLQERMSTALELLEGRISTVDQMAAQQIADAQATGKTVEAARHLPFKTSLYEWVLVVLMAAALALLIFLPNNIAGADSGNSRVQAAIDQTAEDVREAIEEVGTDTGLEDGEREELLETLQASLETLQDEDISAEEAIATANDVETVLQEASDELSELTAEEMEALDAAAEAMEAAPEGDPAETTEAMAESIEGQSTEEMLSTAEALEQAADALEETAPEIAEALREAAEALREGDTEAAQEALQEAAEMMEDMQRQQEQRELTAEELESMAQQMAQDQQEIAGETEETGEPSDEQSSQQGSEQQGEGDPQTGPEGSSGDQEGGEPQAAGERGEQGQEGDLQNPGQTGDTGEASQAGNAAADPNDDTTGAEPSDRLNPNDSAPGQEREYEEVFAPRRTVDEDGEDVIVLETGEGDVPIREVDQTENPEGDVTVPYNQVFGDYADQANQALDTGYIPLGLRDVVREYFTSLAPE